MGSLGGLSPGGSIALGIVVGVLSTSVQSLGLTLQRKSHILEDEKAPHVARRPPHRRRRWQLGMALFVAANLLGSSVQISTLPLPVLSTLQASGLVFNSICATLILGEPFTRWSLWGTLLVCAGAVLIAVFGAIPAPAHNLDELLALLVRPPFVAWMLLQAATVLALAVAVEVAAALLAAAAPPPPGFRLARGLVYGCISGILSAHSLLVAKSAVELVVRTITDGTNQFRHWQAWALVLALVTLALTQLYYLHRGLRLVSTSVLYPLVFCIYNIVAILDGLIYFHQTDRIGPLRACLISLGTAILLSGVLALSWRLSDEQHAPAVGQSTLAPGLGLVEDTESEEEEEEEADGLDGVDCNEDHHGGTDQDGGGEGEGRHGGDDDDERARLLGPNGVRTGKGAATERSGLLPPKAQYVSSYQTFGFRTAPDDGKAKVAAAHAAMPSPPPPPPPPPPSSDTRWTERAEIWGELEDQDNADDSRRRPGSNGSGVTRPHRSSTLPLAIRAAGGGGGGGGGGGSGGGGALSSSPTTPSAHSPLSPFSAARRGVSSGSPSLLRTRNGNADGDADADADAEALLGTYRRSFRRRRRTTGFPGFQARRTSRRTVSGGYGAAGRSASGGLQDALGGLWRMGWWSGGGDNAEGGAAEAASSPAPPSAPRPPATPRGRNGTADRS